MATGFSFGSAGTKPVTMTATMPTTGFSVGAAAAPGTGTLTAPTGGGFSFGGGSAGLAASTGFKLNTPGTTGGVGGLASSTTTTTTAGLTMGVSTTTASGGLAGGLGFKLPGATTASAGTSLFGTPAAVASSFGTPAAVASSFGTPAAVASSFGTPAAVASSTGVSSTATTGFALGGSLAATKPGLTLGGLASGPTRGLTLGATAPAAAADIFTATTTSASRGLGGIDPKTATASSGSTSTSGKSSDAKVIKETALPVDICQAAEYFKKHLKSQKSEREEIARVSQKSLCKVQEDVASLRQLLAVVSNGLQRNTVAVKKLKAESAQELKYAEVAQRTKETPPGLQYENTAPIEYFHRLVDDFENRMLTYRQQIEELESHLASLSQPGVLTPQELSVLFHKVHDSFIALAAQLQMVHEAVKVQKEHYLNWRRVFHGETTDIFEKRRKAVERLNIKCAVTTVGPTPFSELPNATAMAMASAINRTQPAGAPTLGLSTTQSTLSILGSTPIGSTSIFGTATTTASTLGGLATGSLFGSAPKTQTVSPFSMTVTQPLG